MTAIPANIFANNNLITNFSYTFKGCTQLTGNAPELWNRSNVNNYLECFKDDTKLTNYSTIPASWK